MEQVSNDMLAALAARYASGTPLAETAAGWSVETSGGRNAQFERVALARFVLPGFAGLRSSVGTDGSVGDGIGAFAAVHADGFVSVGAFRGEGMTSQTAEMYGILYALRRTGEVPVSLFLDEQSVVTDLQRMARGGGCNRGAIRDDTVISDVLSLLSQRSVTVRHVPDIEGGPPSSDRLPSNRLMGIAHRLAWSARRLTADGMPLEGDALAWMKDLAVTSGRSAKNLRGKYQRFLDLRA